MNGQIRLTEQGEVIASKYASPRSAWRSLETLVAATLEAGLLPPAKPAPRPSSTVADATVGGQHTAYRKLVCGPRLHRLFLQRHAPDPRRSPSSTSARARRLPQRRRAIEDLRAIPWSFSWGQCRVALPAGWCGFGSAIEALLGKDPRRTAVTQCSRCTASGPSSAPCCRIIDMVLAKAISAWPSATDLVEDKRLASASSASSKPSGCSERYLSVITGEPERLASNPPSARSIAHRFPHLDPLSHLQVEAVPAAHRSGKPRKGRGPGAAASTSRSTGSRRAYPEHGVRGDWGSGLGLGLGLGLGGLELWAQLSSSSAQLSSAQLSSQLSSALLKIGPNVAAWPGGRTRSQGPRCPIVITAPRPDLSPCIPSAASGGTVPQEAVP